MRIVPCGKKTGVTSEEDGRKWERNSKGERGGESGRDEEEDEEQEEEGEGRSRR